MPTRYLRRPAVRRLSTAPTRYAGMEPTPEPAPEPATGPMSVRDELGAMSYNDLRTIAKERGIDSTGTKPELVDRIATEAGYA